MRHLFALVICLVLQACTSLSHTPSVTRVTVLHTNDHHGRFWRNDEGEYGMAARYSLIESIRRDVASQGGVTLLLSGGDINTGVPESDMQDAKPDFLGMKALGYDAMALGNHEFDNPIAVLQQQQQWAEFPFLSANTIVADTGKPLFTPYTLVEKRGLRIAIIGLTTTDTAKIGNPDYTQALQFVSPLDVTPDLIQRINTQHAPDMLLALTHMGHFSDGQHGGNAPGDVTLARGLPRGSLNAIIGGHSQNPVCMKQPNRYRFPYEPDMPCQPDRQNGIWIMQAYEWGKYVGRADFRYQGDRWALENYQLLPVNLTGAARQYPEAPEILELLEPFQRQGQAQLNQVLGFSETHFSGDRQLVRQRPAALGRLITQAQQHAVNADLAVISGGGIRASLPAGPVTYKDVLKVHPFGNTLTYVDLSGRELRDYIRSVNAIGANAGGYPQWSELKWLKSQRGVQTLLIGDSPILDEQQYRLALNSFNASGGDGYPRVDQHPGFVDTGLVDAQILANYIRRNSPLKNHLRLNE
ncbi:5'-nucleotidase [Saliniradius amylolyticus]|uniref:5'-nucleotidase n=1 Tax=Saliniradius amylolyticus TaxID=2183582 RepID=A0A2S2E3G8_9ALTE|nr:bifunctional UDP-sugar hydrolase/5'-nucleotidase UshA [Saliniradius amylolyticus]AWL12195.1 5'-nucleotidase [Saliniradius amylolyticus]